MYTWIRIFEFDYSKFHCISATYHYSRVDQGVSELIYFMFLNCICCLRDVLVGLLRLS